MTATTSFEILTTEAVTRGAELGYALRLERVDELVECGSRLLLGVRGEPLHDVKVAAGVERIGVDGVAVQVVRDEGLHTGQLSFLT